MSAALGALAAVLLAIALASPWPLLVFCALLGAWMAGSPLRGATAHEWQVGRLCARFTHLRGAHWRWRPWRRVRIWIHPHP